jgi:ATP-dependent Clp protease ATP-binding subunit ClpA
VFERFTRPAREVVTRAQAEARSLGHDYIGTEHILLGLLSTQGPAAQVLAEAGMSRDLAGREIVELVGVHRSPEPDPAALGVIGIDLDNVRRHVEEAFGPGALDRTKARARARARGARPRRSRPWRRRCETTYPRGHIPFTPRAKKVLELSLRQALRMGHRHIGAEHILLGLVQEGEGLAALILSKAGIELSDVRRRLLDEVGRRS